MAKTIEGDCKFPAFERVRVDYLFEGNARVSWMLHRHLVEPGPYVFQLQVGHTGSNLSTDWLDVGAPVIDTFFVIDPDKRLFGKSAELHYRVKLDTGLGNTYYSDPVDVLGDLDKRHWLQAEEITRKERLRHRVLTSPGGFLLIARRYGPPCSDCVDILTDEVTKTKCPNCFGIGYAGGYFPAIPDVFCDFSFSQAREHRNPNVGMEKQDITQGRFIAVPLVSDYDVWVNKTTDERFFIHGLGVEAAVRAVPVIYACQMRQAPFSDIIYTIKMPS